MDILTVPQTKTRLGAQYLLGEIKALTENLENAQDADPIPELGGEERRQFALALTELAGVASLLASNLI